MNVYDGMPNWATYAVGNDGATVYGGTTQGVGILTTSPFEVKGTWEAGEDTDNAPVEVIGDIAYIGLNGIGIARYDMPTNTWLPTWTEYSSSPTGNQILDPGNEDVTGIVADIRPNHLWIGGDDGFQLIDVINQTEIYDIEKNPLPWMDEMLNGIEHTNFFENRATEYSKASTSGTWDEAFG